MDTNKDIKKENKMVSTSLDDVLAQDSVNLVDAFHENEPGLPVLLIDSDTIAYRCAAVTDGRQYSVGKTAFKYKSDVVKYCAKEGIDVSEIQEEYYPEPLKNAIKIVDISIHSIINYGKDKFDRFNMEFFHSGPSAEGWRMQFLPEYKANRKGKRRPHHLSSCKAHITKRYHEVNRTGIEADDLIGIRAYELRKEGTPYIIVTNDKDLKTIPGVHFDWTTQEESKSSEVEAMKFFYAQTIAGDTTDNIPGVKGLGINNKGTGKAQKIIQKATEEFQAGLDSDWCNSFDTEVEFEYAVCQLLEEHLFEVAFECWLEGGPGKNGSYGCEGLEEVLDRYIASAKCLYILHEEGVNWSPPLCDWRNF